jgi:hypothetical protein
MGRFDKEALKKKYL